MTFWKLMQYESVKPVKQFGFTLIELMVVVAVIAILASIAFPAYQDSVRKSRRTEARDLLLSAA
ncbi:MAG: pilus assembly protein PilE, partial [Alishewanella sp. 34-51-39]